MSSVWFIFLLSDREAGSSMAISAISLYMYTFISDGSVLEGINIWIASEERRSLIIRRQTKLPDVVIELSKFKL